jgi:manganese oxidase
MTIQRTTLARVAAMAGLLALAVVMAGCAPEEETAATPEAPAGEEPTVIVGIQNLEFLEVELFVPPGVAVTWINNDEVAHTVTHGEGGAAAPGALFDERLDGGESFDWSFAEPGLYLVTCTIHPEMNMQVNVIE